MKDKRDIISDYIDGIQNELPNTLNFNLSNENKTFSKRWEFDDVKEFVDEFLNGKTINRFIVLSGIRGVGKTTLLYQIYEYLIREKGIPLEEVLYVSFDNLNDLTECSIREFTDIFLEDYHKTTMRMLNKKIFLLIDEAQYDKNWALSSKMIFDRTKNVFILIIGSSALELEENADADRRLHKKEILPLTYAHHLKLKFNIDVDSSSYNLVNLILSGNIAESIGKEEEINHILVNNIDYESTDWVNYLYYGGFPIYFQQTDNRLIIEDIVKMTKKVVNTDIPNIKNISEKNKAYVNRILRHLSLMDSGEVSMNKISTYFNIPVANVALILDLLEKTHLIFHIEAYGTPSFRIRKARKYYFATSSIRYALSSKSGNNYKNRAKFEGVLIENMIASKLYELTRKHDILTLFYDAGNKGNVDFIIKEEFGKIVPIEVGRGKKDNKQIKKAIDKYKADYGIIISDTTRTIEKKENIIYIPVKTFALL